MKINKLGKTDLMVSQLGIGFARSGYAMDSLNKVRKLIHTGLDAGINFIDTAECYGNSEEILGGINNSEFQVVTKTRHFDTLKITNDEVSLLNQDFNNSLKKLNQIKIYGLLIHNADDLLKPGGEKILDLLQKFKQTNKLMKVGVSVYDHIKLHSILDNFDIDMVQLPFNIIDRRMLDSGMLASLYKKGIEVHARSVFLQGLLLMSAKLMPSKFNRWNNLWKLWHEWLHDNRISPVEASVRYAISFSEISKVLVGVDSVNQLKEIYKASSGTLTKIPYELQTTDADLLNPSNWEQL